MARSIKPALEALSRPTSSCSVVSLVCQISNVKQTSYISLCITLSSLCLSFRGCISNRRMMDSTLSPAPQRMWVFVSLSRKLDTPPTTIYVLRLHNDYESVPGSVSIVLSLSNFCLCSLQQTSVRRSMQAMRWSKSTTRQWWVKKHCRDYAFHVFPLYTRHTANCLLVSILCYVKEVSRYMMSATTTTAATATTTAAMVLPVLCLCRYVG